MSISPLSTQRAPPCPRSLFPPSTPVSLPLPSCRPSRGMRMYTQRTPPRCAGRPAAVGWSPRCHRPFGLPLSPCSSRQIASLRSPRKSPSCASAPSLLARRHLPRRPQASLLRGVWVAPLARGEEPDCLARRLFWWAWRCLEATDDLLAREGEPECLARSPSGGLGGVWKQQMILGGPGSRDGWQWVFYEAWGQCLAILDFSRGLLVSMHTVGLFRPAIALKGACFGDFVGETAGFWQSG